MGGIRFLSRFSQSLIEEEQVSHGGGFHSDLVSTNVPDLVKTYYKVKNVSLNRVKSVDLRFLDTMYIP